MFTKSGARGAREAWCSKGAWGGTGGFPAKKSRLPKWCSGDVSKGPSESSSSMSPISMATTSVKRAGSPSSSEMSMSDMSAGSDENVCEGWRRGTWWGAMWWCW